MATKKKKVKEVKLDEGVKNLSVHNTMGKYYAESLLQKDGVTTKDIEDYFKINIESGEGGQVFSKQKANALSLVGVVPPTEVVFIGLGTPTAGNGGNQK